MRFTLLNVVLVSSGMLLMYSAFAGGNPIDIVKQVVTGKYDSPAGPMGPDDIDEIEPVTPVTPTTPARPFTTVGYSQFGNGAL